jgi:hypothetical protein
VLALCAEAGLVKVGVIAIDGTKVHANASQHANRDYEQLAREMYPGGIPWAIAYPYRFTFLLIGAVSIAALVLGAR